VNTVEQSASTQRGAALKFLLGVFVITVGSGLVACSPDPGPTSVTADVPLQTGKQTTLLADAMGFSAITVDAKNVLYLGGARGIATLAPGSDEPAPMKLNGYPTVATLAAAPDGKLYFVALEGVVETIAPGSTTPEPLPFGKLQQFSQIAVAHDGTVYLGDDQHDKLLKLAPGASVPAELPVSDVDGPGHMVIDADDNLFVSMNGNIVKVAKNATTAESVVGATDHAGGLAVDAAGNLYATDVKANTVSRMPAGGGDWGQLPFDGLQSPTGITVDGDGNVYVINQGRQVVRLAAK
jgi:streptogramin lyase